MDLFIELATIIPRLTEVLCRKGESDLGLEGKQALAVQFAEILVFVLQFDQAKVNQVYIYICIYIQFYR